eukprot:357305-Chlamydomonas_euryale.AAC.8
MSGERPFHCPREPGQVSRPGRLVRGRAARLRKLVRMYCGRTAFLTRLACASWPARHGTGTHGTDIKSESLAGVIGGGDYSGGRRRWWQRMVAVVALNGERYPPFTAHRSPFTHRSPGDR